MSKQSSSKNKMEEPNFQIQINYHSAGIQSVNLHSSSKGGIQWTFCSSVLDRHLEACVNEWLEAYCQKQVSSLELPFDLTSLPPFTQEVLRALTEIPLGAVSTYGQIAALVGRSQAARAVGGACKRNPFPLLIPCHRVIDAKQELRGYSAGGISVKKSLLIFEGSTIYPSFIYSSF